MKMYGAALLGWLLGGLGPPAAVVGGLALAVDAICDGSTDCSWGVEFLLAVPVILVAFLGTGPALVRRLIGARGDLSVTSRAVRSARRTGATSIGALYLGTGSGSGGFLTVLAAVSVGVPAVVTWQVNRRRTTPAEA